MSISTGGAAGAGYLSSLETMTIPNPLEAVIAILRTRLTEQVIDTTTISLFDDLMDIQETLDEDDTVHDSIIEVRVLYNILRCIRICHQNHQDEPTVKNHNKLIALLNTHESLSHCQTYKDASASLSILPKPESN